jgi:hypothetical protein
MRFSFDPETSLEAFGLLIDAGIDASFVQRGIVEVIAVPNHQGPEAKRLLRMNGLPFGEA